MSRLLRGTYRRPAHPPPVVVGWLRMGGHIAGVSIGIGRRGCVVGVRRATPCRHRRRLEELQARVDRTVAYFDELLAGPLDPTTRTVAAAARRSLLTAIDSGDRSWTRNAFDGVSG